VNSNAQAINYAYKQVSDFKPLASFETVEQFEDNFGTYISDCIVNTGGGTGGINCMIAIDMWSREVDFYYLQLLQQLPMSEQSKLKASQTAWEQMRDKTYDFNTALLSISYTREGTLFSFLRAAENDTLITPMIKQRALMLKEWLSVLQSA
jgi:uncharacterized protein YecT (DUF1311 family)